MLIFDDECSMRWHVFGVTLVALAGCGRSPLDAFDAGAVAREGPLLVAAGTPCPTWGTESALKVTDRSQRLVLVTTQPLRECSDAGGDYFVGTEVDSTRTFFFGAPGCQFVPNSTLADAGVGPFWGLVRATQTATSFNGPTGRCIRLAGIEPVTTDSQAQAWAIYRTEAAARAAWAELR